MSTIAENLGNSASKMTCEGDGSFSYNFRIDSTDFTSVLVFAYEVSQISSLLFANQTSNETETSPKVPVLNLDAGAYPLPGEQITPLVSDKFITFFQEPIMGAVNISFDNDDGSDLKIDGFLQPLELYQAEDNGSVDASDDSTANFSYTVDHNHVYRIAKSSSILNKSIDWISWSWSYIDFSDIPFNGYHFPFNTAPSLLNMFCPSGYKLGSNFRCSEECGDGKKVGNEACDDGNTNNNDGCSSN